VEETRLVHPEEAAPPDFPEKLAVSCPSGCHGYSIRKAGPAALSDCSGISTRDQERTRVISVPVTGMPGPPLQCRKCC